jgi:hypothetical protein
MYVSLLNFLDSHKNYLLGVHIMVVEKQLHINYTAVRVSQHVITYFMTITQNSQLLPSIYEVDSKLKSAYLGLTKGTAEKDVKKLAVIKAISVLESRGDTFSLDIIAKTKKKDDLSDVVIQVESLFGYIGIAIIIPDIQTSKISEEHKIDPLLAPASKKAPKMNLTSSSETDGKAEIKPKLLLNASPPRLNLIS